MIATVVWKQRKLKDHTVLCTAKKVREGKTLSAKETVVLSSITIRVQGKES